MGGRRFIQVILPVLLSAVLLASADEPPIHDEPAIPSIDLSELRENRSQWLGKEIRFIFQLDSELETWRPWVTRFGVEDFQAYSVWSDSSLLWLAKDYRETTPRIFARRGSLTERLMTGRVRFERFEVRGIVRSIFLDEPWIELLEVRALRERVSRGTILHGERAVKLMAEKHFELALGELERARSGRLPRAADRALVRLEEQCGAPISED